MIGTDLSHQLTACDGQDEKVDKLSLCWKLYMRPTYRNDKGPLLVRNSQSSVAGSLMRDSDLPQPLQLSED